MIKDTTVKNDVINKIINIIDIEKGLSTNSKNAYTSDIILMNDWFSKQNINFLNAKEIDFKNLLEQCFNRHGHLHCAHNGKEIHFINIKSPVDIQVVLRLRNEALLMAQEIFHS